MLRICIFWVLISISTFSVASENSLDCEVYSDDLSKRILAEFDLSDVAEKYKVRLRKVISDRCVMELRDDIQEDTKDARFQPTKTS